MDDQRFFALLDESNKVINVVVFPKNPGLVTENVWNGEHVWIFDGNSWNSLDFIESLNFFEFNSQYENISYIDAIIGDPQEYLNEQFSNSQENFVVINRANMLTDESVVLSPNTILSSYSEPYTLKEYSQDKSITNNEAAIDYVYDEELNGFIPPSGDDTYNLNFETFEWEPDLNIDYDLHGDGILYRWDGENWILSSNININT